MSNSNTGNIPVNINLGLNNAGDGESGGDIGIKLNDQVQVSVSLVDVAGALKNQAA